jgi:hypothetical protein
MKMMVVSRRSVRTRNGDNGRVRTRNGDDGSVTTRHQDGY